MKLIRFSVLAVFFLFAGLVNATILPPSGSPPVPPDAFTTPTGPTIASTGYQSWAAVNSLGQTTMSGTYISFVESDPNNVFCSGCLDFFFVVRNSATSMDSIERITSSAFGNFLTDVGYTTGPGSVPGGVLPSTVNRSSNGSVIGFNFNSPLTVAPGQTTQVLEIETNARAYVTGTLQIIDGAVATVQAFQPAPLVPEPATVSITLLGILGLALRRRWAS